MKIGYNKVFEEDEVKRIIADELKKDETVKKTYKSEQIEKIRPEDIEFGQRGLLFRKTYGSVCLGKGNYIFLTKEDIEKMIVNYVKKENPHLSDLSEEDIFEYLDEYSWEISY
ncbi:MAG: hypothetical protein B6U68_00975 [Candidatus Aenigmarchaeota archaeon ex4484_14]|nr:MAG: hypothetical protein B6U68_00975 [Candidatus Aenigmarchaeota archaeon ex4484_14]RLJ04782.1 MAG: hypothetical protein DRP08_00870 [Candidatus Aenigmarchaeota archaeon]